MPKIVKFENPYFSGNLAQILVQSGRNTGERGITRNKLRDRLFLQEYHHRVGLNNTKHTKCFPQLHRGTPLKMPKIQKGGRV